MQLQTIPRAYVCASLQVSRIPLRVAERATGNEGNEQWPPVLAYDAFQANVKQVVGSLLRDDELAHQGDLERARVDTVREALKLDVVAAENKAGAQRSFQDRRATAHAKTSDDSDIVDVRYLEIVPDDRVVQAVDFVSDAPEFAGTMTMTWSVREGTGGTRVEILAEDVPDGISAEDHAIGLAGSLDNLARFVEG